VPTAELKEMRCLLTVFNGREVYTAPGSFERATDGAKPS
jgi:hypothetical protein